MMYDYQAKVVRIVDGDTVDLDIDLGMRIHHTIRARLAGLDAPEMRTAEGKNAAAFLEKLIPSGTTVRAQTVKDATEKYGRYLVVISIGSLDINEAMLEAGHAKFWDGRGVRP